MIKRLIYIHRVLDRGEVVVEDVGDEEELRNANDESDEKGRREEVRRRERRHKDEQTEAKRQRRREREGEKRDEVTETE